jgi:hypothetical protein
MADLGEKILAALGGYVDENDDIRCMSCGNLNEVCDCVEIIYDPEVSKADQ